MASGSKIRWTGATWNPMTGCTKVGPGCDNCYMFRQYPRLARMNVPGYAGGTADTVRFWGYRINRIPKPEIIFVNSMSDTFHSEFTNQQIAHVFDSMVLNTHHVFQVLTKRPNRVRRWWDWYRTESLAAEIGVAPQEWPAHIWLGTSVESAEFLPRIDRIAGIAPVTFLSAEPLLGPLINWPDRPTLDDYLETGKLQWVITGGESGAGARPMKPHWATDIREVCRFHRVPFFHKQNGGTSKKLQNGFLEWGGHLLDGVDHSAMPEAVN